MLDEIFAIGYTEHILTNDVLFATVDLRGVSWDLNCRICGEKYITKNAFEKHIKDHFSQGVHECEVCGDQYQLKEELLNHKYIHYEEPQFRCKFCSRSFVYPDDITLHLCSEIIRSGGCECEYNFSSSTISRFSRFKLQTSHIKKCLKIDPFGCSICDRNFDSIGRLIIHTNRHLGHGNIQCDICKNKVFRTTKAYNRHLISRLHQKNKEEKYNKQSRKNKKELRRCDPCEYRPLTPYGFANHLVSKAHLKRVYGFLNEISFKHNCIPCNYSTNFGADYLLHLGTRNHLSLDLNESEFEFVYNCDICDYRTNQKQDYKKHIGRQKHLDKVSSVFMDSV